MIRRVAFGVSGLTTYKGTISSEYLLSAPSAIIKGGLVVFMAEQPYNYNGDKYFIIETVICQTKLF